VYQAHLAKVNAIRHEFPELLLEGRYTATDGFSCSNPAVTARSYTAAGCMAVVATNTGENRQSCSITVPGYKLKETRTIGCVSVKNNRISMDQNGLAVLIFEER
jgi:hypothetical protein